METILVAGGTGHLGRLVVQQLRERGFRVRVLARRPAQVPDGVTAVRGDLLDPSTLGAACRGVDAVVSCAGASMALPGRSRASFEAVDEGGNGNLLAAAQAEGVGRFVYVSLFGAEHLLHTAYARAHDRFAARLLAGGMHATVVRPTGFFYLMETILALARKGQGLVIGDGRCRTNPVHEADVARACVAALEAGDEVVDLGGPEVFTRREIVELAFDVLDRPARVRTAAPGVMRGVTRFLRPFQPRVADLLHFGVEASLIDLVAPATGTETLRAYFEHRAVASRGAQTA